MNLRIRYTTESIVPETFCELETLLSLETFCEWRFLLSELEISLSLDLTLIALTNSTRVILEYRDIPSARVPSSQTTFYMTGEILPKLDQMWSSFSSRL
jgi:hypothetical protein